MELDILHEELDSKIKRTRKKSNYRKVNNDLRQKLIEMVNQSLSSLGVFERLSPQRCC